MKLKHKVALFIVYFLIFLTSLALIDYYAYMTLNGLVMVIGSVVLALIALYMHHLYHKRTRVDEIAKEIEDIL